MSTDTARHGTVINVDIKLQSSKNSSRHRCLDIERCDGSSFHRLVFVQLLAVELVVERKPSLNQAESAIYATLSVYCIHEFEHMRNKQVSYKALVCLSCETKYLYNVDISNTCDAITFNLMP